MSDRGFTPFDLVGDADRVGDLQGPLIRDMMSRIASRHPHYRELMRESGIAPADISNTSELELFPLTDKSDLIGDPERFRLEPDLARPEEYVLWDVAYTTGTSTGRPTPMYQTAHDFRALTFAQRRMADIRGMGEGERIVNLYPITPLPHGAWLRCNQAAAAIGAAVTAGMSGRPVGGFPTVRDTGEVAKLTVSADPTVLWGVPSYVRRVLQTILEGNQRLPALRIVAVSGEPCSPGMRTSLTELAERAGATDDFFVSDSLGATELQCGLVECEPGAGFHNPAPELFHLAAVDETGRHVGDGQDGRLVLTHIDRRGTVLIRFLLGDQVAFSNEPCPRCGRGGGRVVAHRGRSGRFAKIRGNLVDLGALSDAVSQIDGIVEHQLIVRHPGGDRLGLDVLVTRVVIDPGVDTATLESEISSVVGTTARMRPLVEVVPLEVIWSAGGDLKPPRFIDEREIR